MSHTVSVFPLPHDDNGELFVLSKVCGHCRRLLSIYRYNIFSLLLQGDSGGPLVCQNHANQWIQVGVASFTSRNNPERFPAVFARVSEFVDWIRYYVDL